MNFSHNSIRYGGRAIYLTECDLNFQLYNIKFNENSAKSGGVFLSLMYH